MNAIEQQRSIVARLLKWRFATRYIFSFLGFTLAIGLLFGASHEHDSQTTTQLAPSILKRLAECEARLKQCEDQLEKHDRQINVLTAFNANTFDSNDTRLYVKKLLIPQKHIKQPVDNGLRIYDDNSNHCIILQSKAGGYIAFTREGGNDVIRNSDLRGLRLNEIDE